MLEFGGEFRELDETVLGARRVKVGNAAAGVADARHLVDQRYSFFLQFRERFVNVFDLEGGTPEHFGKFIKSQADAMTAVIRTGALQLD